MQNYSMIQFFEWNIPIDKEHWNRLRDSMEKLKNQTLMMGMTEPFSKKSLIL